MANNITVTFSTKDFDMKSQRFVEAGVRAISKGIKDVASEVLRLSQFEVPHDTGMLQNSGHTQDYSDYSLVGYNKVYAARLHEHPEYRFQKGRKGKYLEDPIKNNLSVFRNLLGNVIKDNLPK